MYSSRGEANIPFRKYHTSIHLYNLSHAYCTVYTITLLYMLYAHSEKIVSVCFTFCKSFKRILVLWHNYIICKDGSNVDKSYLRLLISYPSVHTVGLFPLFLGHGPFHSTCHSAFLRSIFTIAPSGKNFLHSCSAQVFQLDYFSRRGGELNLGKGSTRRRKCSNTRLSDFPSPAVVFFPWCLIAMCIQQ